MPQIDRGDVTELAALSHLALTEREVDEFTDQLDAVLEEFLPLADAPVSAVDGREGVLPNVNVTRPDTVVPGLTAQEALSGAAAVEDGRFVAPQILGDEQ